MQAFDLEIFADYFQFYVQDQDTTDDFADGWTDATVTAMFVPKSTAIAIGTARNVDVPVRLEIHETQPADCGGWDRQNEAPLDVASGRLQVMGCSEYGPDAFCADIPGGRYVLRASYFNLASVSEHWLDGDDRYLIQIWPAPLS